MKILHVGDVMGKPGRMALRQVLPKLVDRLGIDLAVVNSENACGGMGITPEVADEFFAWEASVLTSGNHVWQKKEVYPYLDQEERILRPANFPPGTPGRGHCVVETAGGVRVAVLNLQGRVFMPQMVDDPFRVADRLVEEVRAQGVRVIFVDMHAETTSEKIAIARYLDGRVSAVFGTHTHVQTADERILPGGTACITDVGMTGPHDSVIGMKVDLAIARFLTQRPVTFEVARKDVRLEGAVVEIDPETGRALSVERIRERLPDP